ncbi:MAG: hypothetical protein R3C59_29220 [Planctomycetaceae bacterium]
MLQSILDSAEARQTHGGSEDFLTALLQQTYHDLNLASAVLWQSRSDESALLFRIGAVNPASDERIAVQAVHPGKVLTAASASSVSLSENRLLAASKLAGDLNLVLDVMTEQSVPDHELLLQLADVFADLQRRRMLDRQVAQADKERLLNALVVQLHTSLDSDVVANTVATDAALVLNCRRVSVVRRSGRHWELVATTGISQPNARSDASRQICDWVRQAETAAAKPERSLSETTGEPDFPTVRPLTKSGTWTNVRWSAVFEFDQLVSERFTDADRIGLDRVCHHAALALASCEIQESSTIRGQFGRTIRTLTRPRAGVLLILLSGLVAALVLLPMELRIEVYGKLVPTQRAFVFAPDDGVISAVDVDDGSVVSDGDTLCVLTNEDLEVQRESLDGELASANARLAAIDALRGSRTPGSDNNTALLSAEQAELTERVASLTRQTEILRQRIARLTVTSHQVGRVYGDRLQQLLFQRPVQRGQFLFEVANPAAGWELDLRIPEADVRHVLEAAGRSESELPITYALETSPEMSRETRMKSIGLSTDTDQSGILSTRVSAILSDTEFENERPGAGVVAWIHCGQRSLGYVWFRKLIELIQRHL